MGIRTIAGPALERKGDMAAILTALEPRDVLFIDEIHRLSRAVEEVLYPALEDFRLDIVVGQGPAARTLTLDVPPFTLVGATTRTGLLDDAAARPVRHDFPARLLRARRAGAHRPSLGADPRGRDRRRRRGGDRAQLARDAADRQPHPPPGPRRRGGAARGRRSRPRSPRRRSRCHEVDEQGLERTDRELLEAIAGKFEGGPVGLSTLAVALGEEPDTIEDVYEPYLLQLGFHPAHAARPRRHHARPRACRRRGRSRSIRAFLGAPGGLQRDSVRVEGQLGALERPRPPPPPDRLSRASAPAPPACRGGTSSAAPAGARPLPRPSRSCHCGRAGDRARAARPAAGHPAARSTSERRTRGPCRRRAAFRAGTCHGGGALPQRHRACADPRPPWRSSRRTRGG